MNENFSLQSTLEANYLNIRLEEPIQLDEIAIKVTKEDCPNFLIPFKTVEINGSVSLKYKLVNTIALEYASMNFSKAEFVRLYMNLLTPFIKGKDWFLDYHNICIDTRYIFLSKKNSEVLYIYVPEKSYQNSDEDIFRFFKSVFDRTTIKDDAIFQVNMFKFFNRQGVTLADLYSFFQEESQYTAQNTGKSTPQFAAQPSAAVQSVTPQPAAQSYAAPQSDITQTSEYMTSKAPSPGFPLQGSTASVNKQSVPESADKKSGFMGGIFGGGNSDKNGKTNHKSNGNNNSSKSFMSEVTSSYEVPSANSDDEVMNALFGDNKKKPAKEPKSSGGFLFGKKKGAAEKTQSSAQTNNSAPQPQSVQHHTTPNNGASQRQYQEVEYTQVPNAAFMQQDSDKTEIYDEEYQISAYLELIHSPIEGAISRISLDFPGAFITIGRMSSDENQPDIAFSKDFTRIGRRHARIEKRDGRYYVIDLGSANHTLLNGRPLVPNQPYELQDGGELAFTDSKPVRYRIRL